MSTGAVDVRSTAFLRRWALVCGAAELVGIATGAAWWLAWDRVSSDPVAPAAKLGMLAAKGLSGVVEGFILGLAQAWLLRRVYPALDRRAWTLATCLLGVAGWTVGSSFSVLGLAGADGAPPDPGPGATALLAAVFGLAVGAVFGAVQALVLRRVARASAGWIAANAVGWALALPPIFLAASTDAGAATLPLAAASGVAAGLILGLVTGVALRWMPARETTR